MTDAIGFSTLCNWTDKQRDATKAADAHQFTLYGGSRGPGKSYWLRWYMLREALRLAKSGISAPRVGLFCEDYPSLKDRQISKIDAEFPAWMGELKDSQVSGLGFYLHPDYGGGVILLRNLDDASKYQSSEFAAIGVDELTKNSLDTFNMLRGSLRYPGIPKPRFVAASNPGSIGHAWVYQYWLECNYPPELSPLADEFAFVPGLPDDNPHLDASYWQMLETLPPALARAWRWGDWTVFSGQVFTEFRVDLHVIKPITIPNHWAHWRAIDWGYAKPFCCLWFAKDPDTERIYIYRELYQTNLTDRSQAKTIRDNTDREEHILRTYADPSMWERKEDDNEITTTAKRYESEGVKLIPANNDRLGGKRKVHDALANLPDGKPRLMIFETCANLIRTLPMLPYDLTRVEDVDTKAEDHTYDTLRYGLTDMEIKQPPKPQPPARTQQDTALERWLNAKR